MQQYHAAFEQDGEWIIGLCPEIPEANGQGKTIEECRQNLIESIKLVLEDKLEDYKTKHSDVIDYDLVTIE